MLADHVQIFTGMYHVANTKRTRCVTREHAEERGELRRRSEDHRERGLIRRKLNKKVSHTQHDTTTSIMHSDEAGSKSEARMHPQQQRNYATHGL